MPDFWPWPPLFGLTETHRFNSVVAQTETREFRTAFAVDHPVLQAGFHLPNGDFLSAMQTVRSAPTGAWSVPFWPDRQRVTAAAGDTVISCDMSTTSLQAGDAAVLWQSPSGYELVTVDTVGAASVTLTSPLAQAHLRSLLMPVFTALVRQWDRERIEAPNGVRVLVAFEVTDYPDLSGGDVSATFPTLDSLPVIPRSATSVLADQGVLSQLAEFILPGTGIIERVVTREVIDVTGVLTINLVNQQERHNFVRLMADLRGRDGLFWASEPGGLLDAVGQSGAVITVDSALSHLSGRRVLINGGTAHVVDAATANGGRTALTLSGTVPPVRSVAVIRQYRMDTNEIAIEHLGPDLYRASLAIKEAA